jgi:pyruvate,orthophosphate dikinase
MTSVALSQTMREMDMTAKDKLLVSLRIKGFGVPERIAEGLAAPLEICLGLIGELKSAGLAEDTRVGVRLTPAGRQAADSILGAERAAADPVLVEAAGERFTSVNSAFKQLVTRWQMRDVDGKQVRNDHGDAAYDQAILEGFDQIQVDLEQVIEPVARMVPRYAEYPRRLGAALARVRAGELRYVAAPDAESYHTVWFELHQDLIGLLGTTRAKEAAAGRAV